MMPASLTSALFASPGKSSINASRSHLPSASNDAGPRARTENHRVTSVPSTADSSNDAGGSEKRERRFLSAGATPHDLDHASSHDEHRGGGPGFLADVLAVTVMALVHDAGEACEIRAIEILEETDLSKKVDEVSASLCRCALCRLEQCTRPHPCDVV